MLGEPATCGKPTTQDGGGATNLYQYAANDPINFIDSDGRFYFVVLRGMYGAAIGGLTAAAEGESVAGILQSAFLGAAKSALVPAASILITAAEGVVKGWDHALADPCDTSLRNFIMKGIGGGLKGALKGVVGVATGRVGGVLGKHSRPYLSSNKTFELEQEIAEVQGKAIFGAIGKHLAEKHLSR